MATFSLLLAAVLGCIVIARINRNTRLFWTLLLTLALGFVGGAVAAELSSDKDNKEATTVVNKELKDVTANFSTPFVSVKNLVHTSQYVTTVTILKSSLFTSETKSAHYPRCLSPPLPELNNSS